MPSGFSAGFSRGLAGVLKTTRAQELRTQSEEADRALQANLALLSPVIQADIESGNGSVLLAVKMMYACRAAIGHIRAANGNVSDGI